MDCVESFFMNLGCTMPVLKRPTRSTHQGRNHKGHTARHDKVHNVPVKRNVNNSVPRSGKQLEPLQDDARCSCCVLMRTFPPPNPNSVSYTYRPNSPFPGITLCKLHPRRCFSLESPYVLPRKRDVLIHREQIPRRYTTVNNFAAFSSHAT